MGSLFLFEREGGDGISNRTTSDGGVTSASEWDVPNSARKMAGGANVCGSGHLNFRTQPQDNANVRTGNLLAEALGKDCFPSRSNLYYLVHLRSHLVLSL